MRQTLVKSLCFVFAFFRQLQQQQQQQQADLEGGGTRDAIYEAGPINLPPQVRSLHRRFSTRVFLQEIINIPFHHWINSVDMVSVMF